jgi:hypothetical protein
MLRNLRNDSSVAADTLGHRLVSRLVGHTLQASTSRLHNLDMASCTSGDGLRIRVTNPVSL